MQRWTTAHQQAYRHLPGTILENFAIFRSGVHLAEEITSMETIELDTQINKLPKGYDTPIGDGTQIMFTRGFRPALMIARAAVQRPAILLVAEEGGETMPATAGLGRVKQA